MSGAQRPRSPKSAVEAPPGAARQPCLTEEQYAQLRQLLRALNRPGNGLPDRETLMIFELDLIP